MIITLKTPASEDGTKDTDTRVAPALRAFWSISVQMSPIPANILVTRLSALSCTAADILSSGLAVEPSLELVMGTPWSISDED
ncbi:MAG: hypothetical protein F4103_10865 [Boseongicola sp. SB0673_bin_14]|nr:hypothetical protein [Boseongicola sp. SB0673_bin_14]